jgi:hypothetical protein
MLKIKSFEVTLPREVAYSARIAAARKGKSLSRLIRDLLEDYLSQVEYSDHFSQKSIKSVSKAKRDERYDFID